MDMDLDFSDDKIESFLTTKLEEILLKNESLEVALNQQQHALKCSSGNDPAKEFSFQVVESDSWKRTCNNKYSIGRVISTDSNKTYKDIRVLLSWDSEETLCYKVETFSVVSTSNEDCKEPKNCGLIVDTINKNCDIFKGKTYLVIVFDIPQYLHKLGYEICGSIVCNVEGQDVKISFPKLQVSAKDCTESTYGVGQNLVHNIFSIMSCLDHTDLVMIFPEEWTASLTSTFEIHCALKHLKIPITCKSYFVADNVSKLFDHTLIVVHFNQDNKNILFLKIYAANNDQVCALCHHLGTCLQNIVFFPLSYYESYLCKNALFSKELLKEFGRSMCNELEISYKFAQDSSSGNNVQEFSNYKSYLSKAEKNTDKLFLKVSNMKY